MEASRGQLCLSTARLNKIKRLGDVPSLPFPSLRYVLGVVGALPSPTQSNVAEMYILPLEIGEGEDLAVLF